VDRQRRFLLFLAALATVCMTAQAVSGDWQLVLHLTPLFLLATLLLSGHYVGAERIVRRLRGAMTVRSSRRTPRLRLPEAPRLLSAFERSPLSRRGPPPLLPQFV
jgi:hypothetical protein